MASTVCLSYLRLLQTKLKETRRKKRPPHERNAKSSMLRYWCRRKQLLLIMLSIITLINPPRDRICWMRPNSDDWFILADSTFNREQWYENFRVTRDTFTIILNEIEHDIAKRDTPMRKAVPTRKKLAMTLYYFASTAEFRTIANLFGVSRAFLCNCVKDVCCAIIKNLQRRLIYIPKDDELKSILETYKEKWRFPMCAGAIDGTHIAIIAPKEDHTDYVNRKGYHSVVMQALVDCNYLFRDVVTGWPGSVHDARILSNSTIYDKGNDNNLFPDIRESIGGQVVSIVILGDPAYPLLPWLLKAYPENVNTPQSQRVFNYRLSRARMTVENTFGRWKGRFRRFSKRLDMEVPGVVNLIAASCIVHNMCELQRNEVLEEWMVGTAAIPQPDPFPNVLEERDDATDIRSAFKTFFMSQAGDNIGTGS